MIRVAVYAAMRRLGLRWVITLGLIAVALLMMADSARAATCALYTDRTTTNTASGDFELGTRFRVTGEGVSATALRFYKRNGETGDSRTLTLWTGAGSSVATATTSSETADGWQTATFASPVPLTDDAVYVASVTINTVGYAGASSEEDWASCGPIAIETTGSNFGRYHLDPGTFPANGGGDHYYVDVTVDYDVEPPPEEEPDVTDAQLTWWGIWAIVGLLFVLMVAPLFLRVLDIRHGLGGRFERG